MKAQALSLIAFIFLVSEYVGDYFSSEVVNKIKALSKKAERLIKFLTKKTPLLK